MFKNINIEIKRLRFVFIFFIICEKSAFSFTFPIPNISKKTADVDYQLFTTDYDFNGIVELSNCSGSLIRYEQSEQDDKAIILTNGHCVSMIDPNSAYYQKRSNRRFALLDSRGQRAGRVYATMLEYATMTKTDIAVYRLQKTYRQIQDEYGIEAFTLSSERPEVGDDIDIISGYWHRGYSCSIEELVHRLKEGKWVFHDSLRYSRPGCKTIGGTSGSPVILSGTKTVVAINNTGNESGGRCNLNNPCEVDENGDIFYHKGYSYGQQVDLIYSCLDEDLRIDLDIDGCMLPNIGRDLVLVQ